MNELISDIESHTFTGEDRLLFDTNVWLYLYGPVSAARPTETRIYSKSLRDIRQAGSSVYLTPLILCEFINAFARIEYERTRANDRSVTDFKSYRNSALFRHVAEEIAWSATRVLNIADRCQFSFERADVGSMLVHFAKEQADFNDQVLVAVCEENALTLVTHDADFTGTGIPILTANRRLLERNERSSDA